MVSIHRMGRTITEEISSATAYQDAVRTALRGGLGTVAAGAGCGDGAGSAAFVTSGCVVTVGPYRREAGGGGDHDDDDEEEHPDLGGGVAEVGDPAERGEAVVVDRQHQ